jgi:hypothetical protein
MSLVDNVADVAFASAFNIDKIVDVFEGSYNKATQTTTRTSGFLSTIYVHSFSHSFTRPVFTSILWSEDQITWVDGGGSLPSNNSAISFSDSSNIHIATTSNVGIMYYKVIAYWIDGYDSSDPLVPAFTPSVSKFVSDSRENCQKIAAEDDTTYSPGAFGATETVPVNHNLGYIPNAKAFFEPISGEVWPMNAGGLSNVFLYDFNQDEAYLQITSTQLNIFVVKFSNATRRIWYKVYYDA